MSQPQPPESQVPNPEPGDHSHAPQRSVFSGARWHSFGAGSVQASRLLISLVLANMLGRELFGLMAAVQVIVG
ncbi:MAG TPA: hypothetical protein PLJ12_01965, partial [Planctomycetota bacterium]|nr:hypothetical protein [Planctomycetota bacterium]